MKIYVGRWDLLPEETEGWNGLVEMDRAAVVRELAQEVELYAQTHSCEDNMMGVYTPEEFEDTFNQDLDNRFRTDRYWIRMI